MTCSSVPKVHFWRDKDRHEVDFIIPWDRETAHAIECKWNPASFDPKNLQIFRSLHPKGKNYVVSPNVLQSYTRQMASFNITFINLENLVTKDLQ